MDTKRSRVERDPRRLRQEGAGNASCRKFCRGRGVEQLMHVNDELTIVGYDKDKIGA